LEKLAAMHLIMRAAVTSQMCGPEAHSTAASMEWMA